MTYNVRDLSFGTTTSYDLDFGNHESSTYNAGVSLTSWHYLDFQQWCKTRNLGYSIVLVASADIVGVGFDRSKQSALIEEFEQRWVFGPYAVRETIMPYNGTFQTTIGFRD